MLRGGPWRGLEPLSTGDELAYNAQRAIWLFNTFITTRQALPQQWWRLEPMRRRSRDCEDTIAASTPGGAFESDLKPLLERGLYPLQDCSVIYIDFALAVMLLTLVLGLVAGKEVLATVI